MRKVDRSMQRHGLRVVAILATHNEERFIGGCLEHLIRHGVEVFVIDNDSTDRTVAIVEAHLGHGVIGLERFAREGVFSSKPLLERKEQLAETLEADWFVHADPDEVRLPPAAGRTLAEYLAEVDQQGFNAVNFLEFTFVPVRE